MKGKLKATLVRLSKPLLAACMALGVYVSYDIASALFFGEYEYPKEQ